MTAVSQPPPAPPQYSPDGLWWWTGAEWVPAPPPPVAPVPHQPAPGPPAVGADQAWTAQRSEDALQDLPTTHGGTSTADPAGEVFERVAGALNDAFGNELTDALADRVGGSVWGRIAGAPKILLAGAGAVLVVLVVVLSAVTLSQVRGTDDPCEMVEQLATEMYEEAKAGNIRRAMELEYEIQPWSAECDMQQLEEVARDMAEDGSLR